MLTSADTMQEPRLIGQCIAWYFMRLLNYLRAICFEQIIRHFDN